MGTLREHVHGPRLIPLLPSLQFCNIVFPSLSEEEVHQLATAAFGSADAATEPRIDEEGSEAGTSDGGASVKKLPASVLDSPLLTNTPSQRKRMLKRQLSGGMTAREVRLEAVRDAEGPGVIARVTAAAAAAVGASPAPSPGPAKGSRTPSPVGRPSWRRRRLGGGARAAAAWGGARVGADPRSRAAARARAWSSLRSSRAARRCGAARWRRRRATTVRRTGTARSTSPAAAAAATHSRAVLGAVQHLAGRSTRLNGSTPRRRARSRISGEAAAEPQRDRAPARRDDGGGGDGGAAGGGAGGARVGAAGVGGVSAVGGVEGGVSEDVLDVLQREWVVRAREPA